MVWLVTINDDSESWQVIVFADTDTGAKSVGLTAYKKEVDDDMMGIRVSAEQVEPPYMFLD